MLFFILGQNVLEFNKNMHSEPVYVQVLVQGNMTPDEAKEVYGSVSKTFNKSGKFVPRDQIPEIIVNKIPESKTKVVRVDSFNLKDNNTYVINYYQFGPGSLQNYSWMEVACHLMDEPVFDVLRTKEQLGYSVYSMLRNTHGITGISVTVNTQATKFTPDHVDTRIEAFLEWFVREKLEQLDDEEFNQAVTTLVKLKSQVDVTLAEEVNRNWSEIVSREYMFDRRETEIKFLESCDKKQMVDFVSLLINKANSERRKLSVQVVGGNEITEDTMDDNPDAKFVLKYHGQDDPKLFIDDVLAYKKSLSAFPLHKIVQ